MPKYTVKVVVPAANDKLDPVEEKLKISQGRISQVSVTWTPGSQWLHGLVILYEGGQIIPSEGGGQCRGDGEPDVWTEHIDMDKPHPELVIRAWNEGNDYEHDALVSVVVLPIPPDPVGPIRDLINIVKRLFFR